MTLKEKIISALGDEYKFSDEITIDRLIIYYEQFNKAYKDLKNEGYRRQVAANALPPNARPEGNERYYVNIAFTVMNDCAKHIRADLELLGLSNKGKKLEITNKIDTGLSLLEQMNNISDE